MIPLTDPKYQEAGTEERWLTNFEIRSARRYPRLISAATRQKEAATRPARLLAS